MMERQVEMVNEVPMGSSHPCVPIHPPPGSGRKPPSAIITPGSSVSPPGAAVGMGAQLREDCCSSSQHVVVEGPDL